MKVNIVTPEGRVLHSTNVESVTLPTENGVISVLEDHVPMMSLITPGEVIVTAENEETFALAISKGILQINRDNSINILADTAERAEDIDIERAEEARKKALEMRVQGEANFNAEYALLQAKIDKELARVQVGKRWKKVRI